MRRVSWESDNGRTITFEGRGPADAPGPYYFKALSSDLGATAETARAPRQDGVTTYYAALDAPSINLEGWMWVTGDAHRPAPAEYDRQRTMLHQAFAPNRWGTLTYYREDGAVRARCRPLATPTLGEAVGTYCPIDISFTADSPYWETAEEYVVPVGIIQRFWRFPWTPVRSAMGAFNRFAGINNPSEEQIYPTVEVYSTGQYITLTNKTTGEAVTIEHSIAQGQKLAVDLRDVSAYLWTLDAAGDYADPEDVSHWMSLDSEPWGLAPGLNQVAVTNNVPEDTPVAYIKYRVPSLGV